VSKSTDAFDGVVLTLESLEKCLTWNALDLPIRCLGAQDATRIHMLIESMSDALPGKPWLLPVVGAHLATDAAAVGSGYGVGSLTEWQPGYAAALTFLRWSRGVADISIVFKSEIHLRTVLFQNTAGGSLRIVTQLRWSGPRTSKASQNAPSVAAGAGGGRRRKRGGGRSFTSLTLCWRPRLTRAVRSTHSRRRP
jgi:hypothetical protein